MRMAEAWFRHGLTGLIQGSRVTVVEMTSGLLPGADRDLVGPLKRRLEADFAAIRLETKVVGLAAGTDGITARFESADSANWQWSFGLADSTRSIFQSLRPA